MGLVVLGHAIEPLVGHSPALRALYVLLYAFHVPAFVALSGQLSRGSLRWSDARRLTVQLLWPLACFQLLYVSEATWLGPAAAPEWFTPYWLLWYLLSLLWWRLLLPALLKLPAPLLLSVVVCLAAGALPFVGLRGSLSRTLVFLPFFVGGHLVPRARWATLGARWHRAGAVVAFALAAAAAVAFAPSLDLRWLYGRDGYQALGVPNGDGALGRLALLAVGGTLSVACFALVPAGRSALTSLGQASLGVYLAHGLVLRGLQWGGAYAWLGGWAGVGALAVAAALVAGLASAPAQRALRPLLTPRARAGRGAGLPGA